MVGPATKLPIAGLAAPTATVTVLRAGVVPPAPAAVNVKVYFTPLVVPSLGNVTLALVPVYRSTTLTQLAPLTFSHALGLTLSV